MKNMHPRFSVRQDGTTLSIYHVNKGEGLPRHQHTYSHLTICHAGSIKVSNEHRSIIMTKDTQPVNLIADKWHEIEAIEDNTIFVNVFSENKF